MSWGMNVHSTWKILPVPIRERAKRAPLYVLVCLSVRPSVRLSVLFTITAERIDGFAWVFLLTRVLLQSSARQFLVTIGSPVSVLPGVFRVFTSLAYGLAHLILKPEALSSNPATGNNFVPKYECKCYIYKICIHIFDGWVRGRRPLLPSQRKTDGKWGLLTDDRRQYI